MHILPNASRGEVDMELPALRHTAPNCRNLYHTPRSQILPFPITAAQRHSALKDSAV